MKKTNYLTLLTLFMIIVIVEYSCKKELDTQKTFVLQPDSLSGKDAGIHSYYPNTNSGNFELLQSLSWTINGDTVVLRSFIDFDFSIIPNGAEIIDAKLSLYEHHTNQTPSAGHFHKSGSNASYVKRVISAWDEDSITWNNQPKSTDINQIIIPQDSLATQDYLNIDVTNLIKDIINYPSESHGLMIRLINENPYRAMYFASSNYFDAKKRPKLTITIK